MSELRSALHRVGTVGTDGGPAQQLRNMLGDGHEPVDSHSAPRQQQAESPTHAGNSRYHALALQRVGIDGGPGSAAQHLRNMLANARKPGYSHSALHQQRADSPTRGTPDYVYATRDGDEMGVPPASPHRSPMPTRPGGDGGPVRAASSSTPRGGMLQVRDTSAAKYRTKRTPGGR